MQICIVNDYSLTHIGGAVTSLLEQKKSLENAGHTVFLLQLGTPLTDTKLDQSKIIYVKPSFTMPSAFFNLPFIFGTKKNCQKIRDILIDNKIDIVHFQSEFSLGFTTMKAAKQLKIPTVFTIHTFFWKYLGKVGNQIIARVIRSLFESVIKQKITFEKLPGNIVEQTLKNITLTLAKQSNAIISPSYHQRVILEQTSLKTPCYNVPNPFTAPLSSPPAHLVNKEAHPLRIIWIGRCDSEKRPIEFLKAVKIASSLTDKKFFVDIIGDGNLLETMKQKFQLDTVTFYGKQPHEKIVSYIDKSDIVALSSYHFDNQPMTIAEGITRFRPIFYCDERLSKEIQSAGYMSKNESINSMAEAIVKLVENPQIIYKLSVSAKESSQIFNSATYSKTVEQIYSKLLI
jgi:Glycosyltransferase